VTQSNLQDSLYKRWSKLLFSLVLLFSVEWTGEWFTHQSLSDWYPTLVKAPWTPPNWIFPIVWTTIYLLIAISFWLVLLSPDRNKGQAYFVFGVQLVLNFLWSYIFFYLHSPTWALVDIILLWLAIVATIYFFYKHSRMAAYLLIPYLLWVTYAVTLNVYIFMYN
jgi:translocator protein